MSEQAIQSFNFQDQSVRTVSHEGQVWFVAADVCKALGIKNVTDAILRLDADEKTLVSTEGQGFQQAPTLNLVNEFGAYSLVLTSRKPQAKAFKRWLTHEVLPQIARTGQYKPAALPPASNRSSEARDKSFYWHDNAAFIAAIAEFLQNVEPHPSMQYHVDSLCELFTVLEINALGEAYSMDKIEARRLVGISGMLGIANTLSDRYSQMAVRA